MERLKQQQREIEKSMAEDALAQAVEQMMRTGHTVGEIRARVNGAIDQELMNVFGTAR